MKKKIIILVSALLTAGLVSGCAVGTADKTKAAPSPPKKISSEATAPVVVRAMRMRKIVPKSKYRFPVIRSFGAMDLPLGHALQMLLTPLGFALEADETVNLGRKVWVLPFKNLPLDRAVRRILVGTGYACEISGPEKAVRLSSLETRTWRLPFLNLVEKAEVILNAGSSTSSQTSGTSDSSSSSSNGDTSDTSGSTSSHGLSLKTESVIDNPWKDIENSVKNLLSPKGRYLLDRATGSLTVTDTPRVVSAVDAYVKKVIETAARQVEMEVTVTEVTLNDDYQAGVDWSKLAGTLSDGWRLAFRTWGVPNALTSPESGSGAGRIMVGNGSVQAIAAALASFGKVRVVAHPRLRVVNNATAQIFVGESVPYLSRYEKTVTSDTYQTTVETAEVKTGLALSVTPAIDDRGNIRISVAPVLTDLMGIKVFAPVDDVQVSRPQVKTREMRTMLTLRPGETAVMGGLMMERSGQSNNGIPFLKDIPVAGGLFGMTERTSSKVELVISIRPRLLRPAGVEG